MSDSATSYVAYASFGARLRALVIDAAVIAALLAVLVIAGDLTRDVRGTGRVFLVLLLAVVFLYEPLQVWRYGGTIGHRKANLRVVADATGDNPGFGRAFARFLIKSVLGIASFVSMALTRRHQAVHDSLTRTTVQIRDFDRARATDFAFERPLDPAVQLPSGVRRIVVTLLFLLGAFVAMTVLMVTLVTPRCLDNDACTAGETLVVNIVSLSWLAGSLFLVVAGWRGRLWGARARRGDAGTFQRSDLDSDLPNDVRHN